MLENVYGGTPRASSGSRYTPRTLPLNPHLETPGRISCVAKKFGGRIKKKKEGRALFGG